MQKLTLCCFFVENAFFQTNINHVWMFSPNSIKQVFLGPSIQYLSLKKSPGLDDRRWKLKLYHPWDWYIYQHENHKNQPFM